MEQACLASENIVACSGRSPWGTGAAGYCGLISGRVSLSACVIVQPSQAPIFF